jgi:hypothetical protein
MNIDMIAFKAEMERLRGAYIMDIAPACEMYRAALARVAELEAASELAIDKWADAARSETQLRLDAAEARVAELEAQLAAQQWRPVSEPPEDDTTVEAIVRLWYREPRPLLDPDYIYGWRPLPPAPQETTQ